MSEVLGRGTIELVGDARKLKASIEDAKKSLRTLGEGQKGISTAASVSIDKYIGRLQAQNAMVGKSAREQELYKLAVRGASNEQIHAADVALRMTEGHARTADSLRALRTGFIALAAVAGTALVSAVVAIDRLAGKAADFQDMAEKIGDTAESVASLSVAAAASSTEMNSVVSASILLSKNLTGVDDDSKAAGAAVAALGLNLEELKKQSSTERLVTIAKALDGFAESNDKSAVAVALLGKSGAELLPFFKALAQEGMRQVILTEKQIQVADDYSDKMAALKGQISLHAQAIAIEMVPAANALVGAFGDLIRGISGVDVGSKSLKGDTSIQDFAYRGAKALAFLVDGFDFVARMAQVAVTALGGSIGALNQSLILDFRTAKTIMSDMDAQIKAILARPTLGASLEARIAAAKSAAGLPPPAAPNKPRLNFGGAVKRGGADKAAAEAKALADKEMREYMRIWQLREADKENQERVLAEIDAMRLAAFNKQEQETNALLAKGVVDYAAYIDALLDEEVRKGQEILELQRETAKAANEFWNEAARGMQQSMSSFFFDVMQGQLSDLAGSFKKTIDQMVANMLAAKAATALFGEGFGKDSSAPIGGLVGKGLAWLSSAIPMASGGDFMVNKPTLFLAGEAGPERATFSGAGGGNDGPGRILQVTNVFYISGQTDQRSQSQIAVMAGQGLQRAMARGS